MTDAPIIIISPIFAIHANDDDVNINDVEDALASVLADASFREAVDTALHSKDIDAELYHIHDVAGCYAFFTDDTDSHWLP